MKKKAPTMDEEQIFRANDFETGEIHSKRTQWSDDAILEQTLNTVGWLGSKLRKIWSKEEVVDRI